MRYTIFIISTFFITNVIMDDLENIEQGIMSPQNIGDDTLPSPNNGRFIGPPPIFQMPPPGQFYPSQNGYINTPYNSAMMYGNAYPPVYGGYQNYYRPPMYAHSSSYQQNYENFYRKNKVQ